MELCADTNRKQASYPSLLNTGLISKAENPQRFPSYPHSPLPRPPLGEAASVPDENLANSFPPVRSLPLVTARVPALWEEAIKMPPPPPPPPPPPLLFPLAP